MKMRSKTNNMLVILIILVGLTFAATMFLGLFKFSIFAGPPKYSDWHFLLYDPGTGNNQVTAGCPTGEDSGLNSGLAVDKIDFCELSEKRNVGPNEPISTGTWQTLKPGQEVIVKGANVQTNSILIGIRTGTYHWVGDGICDSQAPYLESYQNSPQDCQFLDSDRDGVPDSLDKCPAEIGVRENFGCPTETTPPSTFLETTTTTSVTATTIQQPIGGTTSTTTTSTIPITPKGQELNMNDWVIIVGFIGAIIVFVIFYFKMGRRRRR